VGASVPDLGSNQVTSLAAVSQKTSPLSVNVGNAEPAAVPAGDGSSGLPGAFVQPALGVQVIFKVEASKASMRSPPHTTLGSGPAPLVDESATFSHSLPAHFRMFTGAAGRSVSLELVSTNGFPDCGAGSSDLTW
jgi:hypothetical protein